MGSGITFSGFNNIDFNVILNAIMQQESQPLTALQTRQKALQATDTTYGQLATRLDALQTATSALSRSSSFINYSATSNDTAAVTATASTAAVEGRYDVIVSQLALSQITVSSSFAPDTSTTVVASGGSLTIGGVAVNITGPSTLSDLAAAINANASVPASASIVETTPGQFHLVLTGKDTGSANAFTIANGLTGSTVTFTDTDNDGISGDSAADNTTQATNAALTINGLAISSDSNTVDSGIPGVTLNLLQKDASKTIVISVTKDNSSLLNRVDDFAKAYNDLVKFANDQAAAASKNTAGNLGRDTVLRSVRSELRKALTAANGTGAYASLAEVGIGFDRLGNVTVDKTKLTTALNTDATSVQSLFADAGTGAFHDIDTILDNYTAAGGFVPEARQRLTDEVRRIGQRSDDLTARLAVRREALQREFIAADLAMTRLNSQKNALAGFGSSLSDLF